MDQTEMISNLADNLLEQIFSYLTLKELSHCARVCKTWNRYLEDENNEVWRLKAAHKLNEKVSQKFKILHYINISCVLGYEIRSFIICTIVQSKTASFLSFMEPIRRKMIDGNPCL